jgi:hypothetical protein
MFTKIHQILGKIFLSGASFFWASCDSASSAEELGPLIDIEQEMAKLTPPDTTGLRGKCISEMDYCKTIENFNGSIKYENNAIWTAKAKLDSLINNEQNDSFSNRKKRCYEDAIGNVFLPLYGVSSCSDSNQRRKFDESCEMQEAVRIDDAYLKALQKNDSLERYVTQRTFEKINEKIAKCDNP